LSLKDEESWHSLNFVSLTQFFSFINVDGDEWDSSFLIFLFDIWGDGFAWSAPIGKAINYCDTTIIIEEGLNLSGCCSTL
jgi:hypothetical protein